MIGPMSSKRGQLIIALPDLVDPNFHQTVTLIVEHTEEGALGLTLNRPTQTTVKQAWAALEEAPGTPCHHTGLVYLGGPCPGPLMILHTLEDRAQAMVCEGVYFTAEPDHITWLLEHNQQPMKCFGTHAGWGPGQLDTEIEHQSWISRPATTADVLEAGPRQWLDLIRKINPSQAAFVANPDLLKTDPSMN
jgi:putative transcriptional regulator